MDIISKLLYKSERINLMGLNRRKQSAKAIGEVKVLQTWQVSTEEKNTTILQQSSSDLLFPL